MFNYNSSTAADDPVKFTPGKKKSEIPNRLSAALPRLEILFVFKNERHEEVDDDR